MPPGEHHQRGRQGRVRQGEGERGRRGLRGGRTPQRRVPYHFAHTTLPILSFGDPEGFFRALDGRGGVEHLRSLWAELAARMREPAPTKPGAAGLALHRVDAPGHRLFIVVLPEPARPTEAWMVCLAWAIRRSILGTKPGARRYFTLERGADPDTKALVRFFCEWEGARERHLNHGVVDAADVDGFAVLVKAALAARADARGVPARGPAAG